jgi:hypothetical protein
MLRRTHECITHGTESSTLDDATMLEVAKIESLWLFKYDTAPKLGIRAKGGI